MFRALKNYVCVASILGICLVTATDGRGQIRFAGLGDSIGEGVQSADANEWTQPFSYLNLLALRMGAPFPLPLIRSNLFGIVGDTSGRSRIVPSLSGSNLAVSGADVSSLLNDRADALSPSAINSETDLVIFPRLGSQIEVVATGISPVPTVVACWIGNNDVLAAVTAFDQLDASQMTSVNDFFNDFFLIAARLKATNSKVVFGNIPDVSRIGFLVDRNDLINFLGSDLGLPAGHRTSVVTMLLLGLGLMNPAVLQDPNYVLDPAEIAAISQRTLIFNEIIRIMAEYHGMGVANIHARFNEYGSNPPVFFGVPLSPRFLGGLFSLDGVHPSNIAHGLVANEFISTFNATYGLNIAPLDSSILNYLFTTDPFVDLNGNGRVRGRPWAGLLEVVSALLGFSGDSESGFMTALPEGVTADSAAKGRVNSAAAGQFLDEYRRIKGKDLRKVSRREVVEAFREMFGLERFAKRRR